MVYFWRMTGALMLQPAAYEDVEADPSSLWQSALTVLLSSLAAGIGIVRFAHGNWTAIGFVVTVAFMAWMLWSLVTYQIGARILPTPQTDVTFGQLLRTIGLASAPGVFRVAGLIPRYTTAVFAVTSIWMLAAMVVAVRQALDYQSTTRAFAVCALGWILALSFAIGLGIFFGPQLS